VITLTPDSPGSPSSTSEQTAVDQYVNISENFAKQ
jgi:hypothetical protein